MTTPPLQAAEAALGARLALANPNRMQQYTTTRDAAARALANENDPAKKADMVSYYNGLFTRYAAFTQSADAELMQMGPADPYFVAQHSRMQEANFWHSQHQTHPHPALEAMRGEMLGPNMLTSSFYDEKAAKRESSPIAGIKPSGIIGAVAGFFASDLLGLDGMWKWIGRAIGVFGGAAVGNMVAGAINPPEQPKPVAYTPVPPQSAPLPPPLPSGTPLKPATSATER